MLVSCSPLKGSQRPQRTLGRHCGGFSSTSSPVLASGPPWGRYWACLASESPHPRMTALGTHSPVVRAIAVPLLTVVSQSGEQTPPRHTQDIWRTVSEDSASHVCQTGECVFRGNTATSSDNAAVRGGCHVWSRRRFFAVGQDIDLPTRPVLSTTHVMFVCQSRPDRVSSLDTHA